MNLTRRRKKERKPELFCFTNEESMSGLNSMTIADLEPLLKSSYLSFRLSYKDL